MTYTVVYERDEDGVWNAEVVEIPQVHTFGRTLGKTEANIRDALELWLQRGDFDLTPSYRLDGNEALLSEAATARARAVEAQTAAGEAMRVAAWTLSDKFALSQRDIAHLLGISFQRVQQLLAEHAA